MHSLLQEKMPQIDLKYVFNYFKVPISHSNYSYYIWNAKAGISSDPSGRRAHQQGSDSCEGIMEEMLKKAIERIQIKYGKREPAGLLFPLLVAK